MNKDSYIDNNVSLIISVGSREIIKLKVKSYILAIGRILIIMNFVALLFLAGYTHYSIYKEKKELTGSINKIESEIDFLKAKQSSLKADKAQINKMLGLKSY